MLCGSQHLPREAAFKVGEKMLTVCVRNSHRMEGAGHSLPRLRTHSSGRCD